jgi:hypothetical protein
MIMRPYPEWLHLLAWFSLLICIASAVWIMVDEFRSPQKMWIMNVVWPITGLYMGPLAIWLYWRTRPAMSAAANHGNRGHDAGKAGKKAVQQESADEKDPSRLQTTVATFHCGAGCTLGDLLGETLVPAAALFFAGEFGSKLLIDFFLAYLFGIVFQYFTVAPMRNLGFWDGLKAALRADTISIALFQVGMFGWMILVRYVLFPAPHLQSADPVFWFMMQIAMVIGFFMSYPANRWLIRKGWKEKMPHEEAAMASETGLEAA